MEKKIIANGPLGTIGSYEVAFDHGSLNANIQIGAVDLAIHGLEKCKSLIPGTLDDMAIDLAIAQLNAMKNNP